MWIVGALLAAWLFYAWALTRVPAWGEMVMTTFDCYLPGLAKQLGFELPPSSETRIAFWTAFSQMLVYRRDPEGTLAFRPEEWPTHVGDAHGGERKTASDESDAEKHETDGANTDEPAE